MFEFLNLDGRTREIMMDEIELDESKGTLYISPRLSSNGKVEYPRLVKESVRSGNTQTLAQSLKPHISPQEMRKGKFVKTPYNANETLAEGEFNRFYIRALCQRAIEDGEKLEVYRAKAVVNARSASQAKIGESVDPIKLLEDLRNSIGVDTALKLPPGPNSGLSVKIS